MRKKLNLTLAQWGLLILLVLLAAVCIFLFKAWIFMLIFNWLVAPVFGLMAWTFGKACAITAAVDIVLALFRAKVSVNSNS